MREYYLKAMGIQPWFLRTTTEASGVACYVLQLKKAGKFLGLLLAESEQKNKDVAKMLWNICRALNLEVSGEWCSDMPDVSELLAQSRFVITMGEFSRTFGDKPVIKTLSPKQLLADPKLKRAAWNALQKVKF